MVGTETQVSLVGSYQSWILDRPKSVSRKRVVEYTTIVNDCFSVCRNTTAIAISALRLGAGVCRNIVTGFGIAGAVLKILSGINTLYSVLSKTQESSGGITWMTLLQQVGEFVLGIALIVMGLALFVFDSSSTAPVLFFSGLVINIACFIVSGIIIAVAMHGALKAWILSRELDGMLREQNDLGNQLKTKLGGKTSLEIAERLDEFSACSSEKVCLTVLKDLIKEDSSTDNFKSLIAEAKRESWKTVAKQCAVIAASIVSVVGLLVAIYCPILWLSPLLFAVGSCVFLTTDSNYCSQTLGDFFFQRSEAEKNFWTNRSDVG